MLKTPNRTLDSTVSFARFVKYAALLIALAAFITIPVFTFIFSDPDFAWVKWEMAVAVIISLVTAALAHRGQPQWGAIALSITIMYTTLANIQPDDFLSRPNGATLIIPVTIMGFVFGVRIAFALASAVVVAMLLLPVVIPGAAWSAYTVSNVALHFMSVGLLWLIHHLFAQLHITNTQLRESTDQLHITNKQLAEANEREQETRNLMRYFQHELKGYIVGLKGLQSIIRDLFADYAPPTNEATDSVMAFTYMEQTIEDIDDLLHKLLVIGRQGSLPAEQHQLVNLRSLLEHERERFLATSRCPNLTVTVEAPAELTVSVSRLYLVLAVRTALRNALDALSQKPAAYSREIQLVACSDGTTTVLAVRDNGPGFSSDGKANQIVPGWSAKDGGNGLGLALIRHVAMLHGGSMRFGNAPSGVGAWVEVELALQPAPEMLAASSTS